MRAFRRCQPRLREPGLKSLLLPDSLFDAARFYWRRLSARWHRLCLAVHARGWRGVLAQMLRRASMAGADFPPGTVPHPPPRSPAPGCQRILWIDATTPRPDRDSGSLRAFNLMRLLLEQGHALDFMPDDGVEAGGYADALRALGVGLPVRRGGWPAWLSALDASYNTLIISRYHVAHALNPLVRRLHPKTRIVLDTVDLHHLREQREAEFRRDLHLQRLAAMTRQRELSAIAAADTTWVVSPEEADLLAAQMPQVHCLVIPNLHEPAPIQTPFERRCGVLFVGGAVHPPNVDAVYWLIEDIIPKVQAQIPDCMFHLVGEGLRAALPGRLVIAQGVHLHGHVPDLTALLGQCRVSVAPLRFGAGVNGKINQAMAAGLPVVATRGISRGLCACEGEDILLADDAEGLAAAIVRLHQDPALWGHLARGGVDNIRRYFSADAVRDRLVQSFPHVS